MDLLRRPTNKLTLANALPTSFHFPLSSGKGASGIGRAVVPKGIFSRRDEMVLTNDYFHRGGSTDRLDAALRPIALPLPINGKGDKEKVKPFARQHTTNASLPVGLVHRPGD